ncbi:MAG: type III-A CRISPR-associated protein Cas10/Csm1 [Bacteroidota bacterium]
MANSREIIYLAALLHDIGKFYQRTDPNNASKSGLLSEKVKQLEASISPLHWQSKQHAHKHVLWTAQFFENLEQHFTKYLKHEGNWTYDKLLRLSAAHHAPAADNLLERIIQKADHYSSGVDRDVQGGPGWKDAEEETDQNWVSLKETRMRSVFEGISLKGNKKLADYAKKLPLKPISVDPGFFPIEAESQTDDVDYKRLWEQFVSEIKCIENKTINSFNDSLLFLLEKYTCRIPSSTKYLPDVSLYDHLKTTAAFAISLYDYISEKGYEDIPSSDEKPFALVGGSLSGIQKFIYNIVAKGAAKNLKGRSFYLQLLTDNVVQLLLSELGLQSGNLIYASGGGFYLIAPNTKDLPEKLKAMEEKLARQLFKYHGTELYLALDFAPFGEAEIFCKTEGEESIASVWKILGENLSRKKSKRFETILQERFADFFEPIEVSTEKKKDVITGEELGKTIKYLDDNFEQPVNEYTWMQIELGKALKKTDYWILAKEKVTYFPTEVFWFEPIGLGQYNYLVTKKVLDNYENQLKLSADNVRVIHFNKENFLEPLQKVSNNVHGFTWYGGNDFAENDYGEPKSFEELAGVSLDGPNYKESSKKMAGPELTRLGVLRMDVDNLGAIFRRGFAPEHRSLSRYSSLSRSLDWFFKGYINTIWKSHTSYSQFSQIIYSGGDDLFVVGKWDVLIQMASDIQKSFKEWVCNNSELTLSGGMATVGARFPILKSASYSEIFEKAGKQHNFGEIEKNAFAFISYKPQQSTDDLIIALNWDNEYPYLKRLKEELIALMKITNGLSEGFSSAMYNLLQQSNMDINSNGRYYPKNHRIIWLVAYQFKRSSDGKHESVKDFFRNWDNNIMTGKVQNQPSLDNTIYHSLQFLAIAARWAALEERSLIKSKFQQL